MSTRKITKQEHLWILLLFDLYWLRYEKPGEQWYELTDYLRDKLVEDGFEISYTKDNLIAKTPSRVTVDVKNEVLGDDSKKGKGAGL